MGILFLKLNHTIDAKVLVGIPGKKKNIYHFAIVNKNLVLLQQFFIPSLIKKG